MKIKTVNFLKEIRVTPVLQKRSFLIHPNFLSKYYVSLFGGKWEARGGEGMIFFFH